jgi:hypothetical protein
MADRMTNVAWRSLRMRTILAEWRRDLLVICDDISSDPILSQIVPVAARVKKDLER